MPIVDYKRRASRLEVRLFSSENISANNKAVLRRFLVSYDESPARHCIFYDKIKPLLIHFPKIEDSTKDRDEINLLFAELRAKYSPATYGMYINVTKRFLTWLNEGTLPKSMCDIKPKKNANYNSALRAEDMIDWDEGVRLVQSTCDSQVIALGLTQLDCGFRPSEIMDLKYSAVTIESGLAIIELDNGKTGGRTVVAHRCVPALMKWMSEHPTKKANDPLWVARNRLKVEGKGEIEVKRYSYSAVQARLRKAAKKINFNKKFSFYRLRHSSCRLDKLDNLPPELAAGRHGHSIRHFIHCYARCSAKDVINRFNAHYGRADEKEEIKIDNIKCHLCGMILNSDAKWCHSCGAKITTKAQPPNDTISPEKMDTNSHTQPTELESLKLQLALARQREESFRSEQQDMLKQMKEIQQEIALERKSLHESS